MGSIDSVSLTLVVLSASVTDPVDGYAAAESEYEEMPVTIGDAVVAGG